MEIKLNIGQQDGTTLALKIEDAKSLYGLKIGQTFKGELIDKTGYTFLITGGSNKAGVPMRSDVEGSGKKKVLLTGGVGFNPKRNGIRRRKLVAGNTVGDSTAQLNVKVEKAGKAPLIEAPAEDAAPDAA